MGDFPIFDHIFCTILHLNVRLLISVLCLLLNLCTDHFFLNCMYNYNFSLLPVKYWINFIAGIGTFVWAVKQI